MSWHVASLVVRCRPEYQDDLLARLRALPATEVCGAKDGRIVVLVEGEHEYALADGFAAIRALPHVLGADLVHHEIDSDDSEAAHVQHAP